MASPFEVKFSDAPEAGEVAPQGPSTDIFFDPLDRAETAAQFVVPNGTVNVIVAPTAVKVPKPRRRSAQRVRHEDEGKLEIKILSLSDEWMEDLIEEPFDADWLDRVEPTIVLGSQPLHGKRIGDPESFQAILGARKKFWGEDCGWANPEHPCHGVYRRFIKHAGGQLRPTNSLLNALRVMSNNFNIDTAAMIQRDTDSFRNSAPTMLANAAELTKHGLKPKAIFEIAPSIIRLKTAKLVDRWEHLEAQGLDVKTLVASSPQVLHVPPDKAAEAIEQRRNEKGEEGVAKLVAQPSAIILSNTVRNQASHDRRLKTFTEIVRILKLSSVIPEDIVKTPGLESVTPQNLFAKVKIFAKFGNRETTSSQFARTLSLSIDSYMLYLAERHKAELAGDNPKTYSYSADHINRAGKRVVREEREDHVKELLSNPEYLEYVGRPIISAYVRYKDNVAANPIRRRSKARL